MPECKPPPDTPEVEASAQKRALDLGLDWATLSDAHKEGIRQAVWAEMRWHD